MTQELYQMAMKFAGEKHHDQKMPGHTANYLLHVSNVAMEILMAHHHSKNFDLNYSIQVAILHDVLEDTPTSFEEVRSTFGAEVAFGVLALTKDVRLPCKEAMMQDSLNRINQLQNEVGIVKIADRITNLQSPPDYWTEDKKRKYLKEAMLISSTLAGKNDFLNNRLDQKIRDYTKYLVD